MPYSSSAFPATSPSCLRNTPQPSAQRQGVSPRKERQGYCLKASSALEVRKLLLRPTHVRSLRKKRSFLRMLRPTMSPPPTLTRISKLAPSWRAVLACAAQARQQERLPQSHPVCKNTLPNRQMYFSFAPSRLLSLRMLLSRSEAPKTRFPPSLLSQRSRQLLLLSRKRLTSTKSQNLLFANTQKKETLSRLLQLQSSSLARTLLCRSRPQLKLRPGRRAEREMQDPRPPNKWQTLAPQLKQFLLSEYYLVSKRQVLPRVD